MELYNTILRDALLTDKYVDNTSFTYVDSNQAKNIRTRDASKGAIKQIIFHCTDAPHWSPSRLGDFFVSERKFPVCGYHWYVMADKIFRMVSANLITYHAAPYNSDSISFSIDYFATRDESLNIKPDPVVLSNALLLATYLCIKHKVEPKNLFGHREKFLTGWNWTNADHTSKVLRKTCPGLTINLDEFRFNCVRSIQYIINELCHTKMSVDGIFGPKTSKIFSDLTIIY